MRRKTDDPFNKVASAPKTKMINEMFKVTEEDSKR